MQTVMNKQSTSANLVKECCWLLSNVLAGTRDQIQAVIVAGLLPKIIHCLERVAKTQIEGWLVIVAFMLVNNRILINMIRIRRCGNMLIGGMGSFSKRFPNQPKCSSCQCILLKKGLGLECFRHGEEFYCVVIISELISRKFLITSA